MDILFHWLIPVVIVMAFSKIDKRTILLLSPFALFPEIDAFFGMHRMILHNVFVVLIPLLLYFIWFIWKRKKENKLIFILIAYFLLSHVILDLEYSGVALFYPLTDEIFYFSTDLMMTKDCKLLPVIDYGHYGSGYGEPSSSHKSKFVGNLDIRLEYIIMGRCLDNPFITNSSIMVLILILLFIAVQSLLKK